MVEANAARGQFKGWGRLDREIKVKALAQIVADSHAISFHVSIDLLDFEAVFDKRLPFGLQNPYLLAFIAVTTNIGRISNSFGDLEPVDCIFDDQQSINRVGRALYNGIKDMQPSERSDWMGRKPKFLNDQEVTPLQAADMLAWHVQRGMRDGVFSPRGNIANLLIQRDRHFYLHVNRACLETMRSNILGLPNVELIVHKNDWKQVIARIEAESTFIQR